MVEKINIQRAFTLAQAQFIDVRSPKEFEEDHIPQAINVPILDNEERAVVGTIYKQISREQAIKEGFKFYEQKIPTILKAIEPNKNNTLIVYCWRGGMRSEIISTLFAAFGYTVYQLEGGYKSYRQWVISQLENYPLRLKLVVLHGLTCSGKTQLLKKLFPVLDLEELAGHRGSLYGALGLRPKSQKNFETRLLQQLNQLNNNKFIFVEGESRKIGNIQIPEFFWKAMKQGTNVLITRSLDLRVKEAVKEYFTPENREELIKITSQLQKIISQKTRQKIIDLINEQKDEEAAKLILVEYYDRLYSYSLDKIKYQLKVKADNLNEAAKLLLHKFR